MSYLIKCSVIRNVPVIYSVTTKSLRGFEEL
jgi:hypothetical protein